MQRGIWSGRTLNFKWIILFCISSPWWREADGFASQALIKQYQPGEQVAIAVQGKVDGLNLWMSVYEKMQSRFNVDLFLLSYDRPYKCPSHIYCFYFPNSTWTTGRNALARKIYGREQQSDRTYKYWAFHDSDTWDLACVVCRCGHSYTRDRFNRSACCFDQYVMFLLGPQHFAQVSPGHVKKGVVTAPESPFELFRVDCIDAMMNAYHREALPVVLPYISILDNVSWWLSQALEFHTMQGCLSGGTAVLGGYGEPPLQEHSPYPQGRNDALERATVDQVFGSRGLVPWPIGGQFMEQGNCGALPLPAGQPELISEISFRSAVWMTSKSYLACRRALQARFDKFVRPAGSADPAPALAPAPSRVGIVPPHAVAPSL